MKETRSARGLEERRGEARAPTHHVGLRVARDEGGAEHLGELLDVRLEARDGVDDADEGCARGRRRSSRVSEGFSATTTTTTTGKDE